MDIEYFERLFGRLSWLPALARQFPLVLLALALTLSVEARADTHDLASARNFIDGIWDIEDVGSVKIESMTLSINREFASLGKRSKDTPLVAAGIVRHIGDVGFRKARRRLGRLARSEDGTITMSYGQFGYCNCGSIDYTMRPTGDPDVMIGEWVYTGDERGISIWRRRPPIRIEAVSYVLRHSNKAQRFVRDAVVYNERPLNVADWPKAYERSIWLTISGQGFAGGHEVWLEPGSQLKLGSKRWRCHDGRSRKSYAGWTDCGNWDTPDLGVVGLVMVIRISKSITSGIKTLWIDNQPVHFYVHAIAGNDPKIRQTDLTNVEIIEAETLDPIDEIAIGQSFRVRLTFAEDPDTEITETVTIRTSDGAAQEVRVTGNDRVIVSDPILVAPSGQ